MNQDLALPLALALLGAAVLLGVWAYHQWRIRRLLPPAPRPEPVPAVVAERVEPHLEPSTPAAADEPAPRRVLTPDLDAIVELALERVVSGEAVLASGPATRHVGTKPLTIEALPEGAPPDAWELPRAGQRYARLRAGVQLANRAGALNEIEYSEFVHKVGQWAEHLVTAPPDFPDMLGVVQRARELDQFAAEHDAQLALTLRARRTAWNPGYVTQHALRLGFVPGTLPGRMVWPGHDGSPWIVLQFETQAALADDPALAVLREVRLVLDAPQIPQEAQPYDRLRALATALAQAMDGWIGDDQGNPLDERALDTIGAELQTLYDRLHARGLAAGSPQAKRLFS
ncbi:MAG: cell division protein FtsZ [Tepidimonas ignava]|jgi:hypothetical protein|uniref:cell division protein FtsZ n=1 Tax=Tepidimonas ignava TaxID=114249 RepID=UPI002A2B615F|nr:cell division protein FtsZ [Tepidimonas ignava]